MTMHTALPHIRGTRCTFCTYEVPALGLAPDRELAWFERFEGRLCPHCWGTLAGIALGVVLSGLLARVRLV